MARHENEIGGTTDVAAHPEFADRRDHARPSTADPVTGWFTEDFTLAELRTLRAKERLPQVRPANTAFDGKYVIPTLEEVLDLARHSRTCSGHPVGVAPETKHPSYFASIGHPDRRAPGASAQRREPQPPQRSGDHPELRDGKPATPEPSHAASRWPSSSTAPEHPTIFAAAGDSRTYADLATAAGLRKIATYADVVGLCKDVMIPRDAAGRLTSPTPVIGDAHAAGLTVVGWTFRRENTFLPTEFRSGPDPTALGNLAGEIRVFLAAGMDGYFTDNPDVGSNLDVT